MRLPQFTLAGILWAVFWLAVCFAAWRINPPLSIQGPVLPWAILIMHSFRFFTIPTAIGALFGHTLRGFIVGIVLYLCMVALEFVALATGLAGD